MNINIANSIKGKDNLISELTAKLKESTRVIQSVKTKNQELREHNESQAIITENVETEEYRHQCEMLELKVTQLNDQLKQSEQQNA